MIDNKTDTFTTQVWGRAHNSFPIPEVWSIVSTLFLQDMPFLAMRMYVIFGRNTYDRMLVFFTLKNSIVFLLEIYWGFGVSVRKFFLTLKFYNKLKRHWEIDGPNHMQSPNHYYSRHKMYVKHNS